MMKTKKELSIEEKHQLKPLDFLKKLSTQRLLTYYRIERKKVKGGNYFYDCCGEPLWKIHDSYKDLEQEYNDWCKRLEEIKAILNTREHIERKTTKQKSFIRKRGKRLHVRKGHKNEREH